jgi:DNA recombination protein RmuC
MTPALQPDLLAIAALVAAAVNLVVLLFVAWRLSQRMPVNLNADQMARLVEPAAEMSRSLREESARVREEQEKSGARLRDELRSAVAVFGDSLRGEIIANRNALDQRFDSAAGAQAISAEALRAEVTRMVQLFAEALKTDARELGAALQSNHAAFEKATNERLALMGDQLRSLTQTNADANAQLRKTLEERLETLRADNEKKLEQMRATVEEKLQSTLEKRLGESFKQVSERLETVHRGLGEMQSLAAGVGDLKKVLSNVKDRGGWAEMQLGALLDDKLARDQYVVNARIDPASKELVEFAIRLPGVEDGKDVLLPIDAKFPKEDYERLVSAWESGDGAAAAAALDALDRALELEAKKIGEKYVKPPYSTDFAILYLPTEGLFAEAMRRPGLAQRVQQKFRVTIAGPTTLSALLTSLQMGFRTLAIQKRSSEVWEILAAAKSEFEKYALVWERLAKQLETAQNTARDAGTRTRVLAKKLRSVETLGASSQSALQFMSADEEDVDAAAPAENSSAA